MTHDEDPLFEESNEEDYEEEEDEDYEDEDEDYEDEDYEDEYDVDSSEFSMGTSDSRLGKFMEDPWPTATFVLMLIGFAIVLGTPPAIWEIWLYLIEGLYFTFILGVVAIVLSIQTVMRNPVGRMKYVGYGVLLMALFAVALGFLDTASWVVTGHSILPFTDTPLTALTMTLLVFGLYSLWLFQRSTEPK
ncbi:MAG: hypothetical protein ACFFAY_06685 [Promethearchaeota archaeon]